MCVLFPLVEAVKSYRRWNEVRVCLLLVAALVNLSVYYWTMDTTGVLCAGMVLVASLFCVPGRERVVSELDLQRNEECTMSFALLYTDENPSSGFGAK